MFLERYKESVVRVRILNQTGEEMGRAMGVSIGRSPQLIATPLSLVLGNALEWADKVEISHARGNKYFAKIAYIDEQLDLVLLAPENSPAPIPFTRPQDERPQITVFTISFEDGAGGAIQPKIHRSNLAAVNPDFGSLSISGPTITNDQAGTGIINMQGELVGMMLPSGNGVLASALSERAIKAKRFSPIPPSMLGVVMGRGVLVDPTLPEAFPSIGAALKAMKEGKAPKADLARFNAAKDKTLSPKEADRVILKVMPGTYKENTLELPSSISFTGSGTNKTVIVGLNPKAPVISAHNAKNLSVTNFRVVPAPLQATDTATLEFTNTSLVRVIGNLIEGKGGSAISFSQTVSSAIFGNAFPEGNETAINCKSSAVLVEGNAFLGAWGRGISIDQGCSLNIVQNLFVNSKTSISVSGLASGGSIVNNTFIKSIVGVRFSGDNKVSVKDNLFFEDLHGLYGIKEKATELIDRNAYWKSKITFPNDTKVKENRIVQAKPVFENPEFYDFRIHPGTPQLYINALEGEESLNFGAFQRKGKEMLGRFTGNLARALETATGQKGLAEAWGYK